MDEALILRYLKVRALAERGSPGEKDNAKRIVAKLEKENPNIARFAEEYLRSKEREMHQHTNTAPPPSNERNPFVGNWETIFQFAHQMYTTASGFADTIAQAQRARKLAERIDVSTRVSRSGDNVALLFKMDVDLFEKIRKLNDVQASVFRTALHEMLDAELDRLFER